MPLINSCIFCKFKDLAVNGTIKKYTVQQGYSITTGEFVDDYKIGFGEENIIIYNTKEELIDNITEIVKADDVILVKASRGAKFEEIVTILEK